MIFVPFYSLYWWYTRGEKVNQEFSQRNYASTGNGIVYLILAIFGLSIVSMAIMQSDFNSLMPEIHLEQRSTRKMNENLMDLTDLGLSEEELFCHIENNAADAEKITAPRYSYWRSVLRVFFRKKINSVILAILAILVVFSFVYPMFSGYDATANVIVENGKNLNPADAMDKYGHNIHWILGSGPAGESVFDKLWAGSRISLALAFVCALINMTIGVVIGAIWGFSKKFDIIMTEVYNIVGNVPYILLISVIVMILTASFWSMVFALTLTGWLGIAYFIRTQVIIIRDREYNLASRCLGTSTMRIALKNILPFMVSVIVTIAATEIPSYISYEAFLSYIGLQMSDMSLGKIIERASASMFTPGRELQFWAPVAVASVITVVLYVVGQNLGDASDPRTHM